VERSAGAGVLQSIEDLFGLTRLGDAPTVKGTFDKGVFTVPP